MIIPKETVEKLMKIKGKARGITIKQDWYYILKEYGEETLKKVEEEMKKLGVPVKYDEIKTMNFYPIGLDMISILVIGKILNFKKEDYIKLGFNSTKYSLFVKVLMKYFVSVKKSMEEAPKMWRRHYTIGDLTPVKVDEKQKLLILRLENLSLHKPLCYLLNGYFSQICKMITGNEITCKEIKCTFNGDPYHEFLIKWQ